MPINVSANSFHVFSRLLLLLVISVAVFVMLAVEEMMPERKRAAGDNRDWRYLLR